MLFENFRCKLHWSFFQSSTEVINEFIVYINSFQRYRKFIHCIPHQIYFVYLQSNEKNVLTFIEKNLKENEEEKYAISFMNTVQEDHKRWMLTLPHCNELNKFDPPQSEISFVS